MKYAQMPIDMGVFECWTRSNVAAHLWKHRKAMRQRAAQMLKCRAVKLARVEIWDGIGPIATFEVDWSQP